MQVECDIIQHLLLWVAKVLEWASFRSMNKKIRALLIDPPHDNTGQKLPYPTMPLKTWLPFIPFDSMMEDGYIFIWVSNGMGTKVSNMMKKRGWRECQILTWLKYDSMGRPLFRGGYDMMHVSELCYVFKRKKAMFPSDKFSFTWACPNAIHTKKINMKVT
jgi:N6-adenosine-specific RNA methylase IME4